ncbi:MAG: hypothetical protein IPP00_02405 [Actinomycetales bacterium]|uniref:Uncharacterized protein n=1 Tax=Candidatus Phosphoribacter hodrii TaxID=2953743 RepID=A0A9D7XVK5_9MICO|nr:hypothetical protein [Candidatus Phosphoribacter hodrii]
MTGLPMPRWRVGGRRASATALAASLAVSALLGACGQSASPRADASDFDKRATVGRGGLAFQRGNHRLAHRSRAVG